MSYNKYRCDDTESEVWDDEPTERDWALWIYGENNSEIELEVIF